MMSPNQTISAFLDAQNVPGPRSLEAAIFYSQSMVRELQEALRQWRATMHALTAMKAHKVAAAN